MNNKISLEELKELINCLDFKLMKIRDTKYPSYEMKTEFLENAKRLQNKLRYWRGHYEHEGL